MKAQTSLLTGAQVERLRVRDLQKREDGQRGCALNEPRENLEAQMLSQEGA